MRVSATNFTSGPCCPWARIFQKQRSARANNVRRENDFIGDRSFPGLRVAVHCRSKSELPAAGFWLLASADSCLVLGIWYLLFLHQARSRQPEAALLLFPQEPNSSVEGPVAGGHELQEERRRGDVVDEQRIRAIGHVVHAQASGPAIVMEGEFPLHLGIQRQEIGEAVRGWTIHQLLKIVDGDEREAGAPQK